MSHKQKLQLKCIKDGHGTDEDEDLSLGEIVYLNVGGHRFATSHQTLTSIPDTFFTSLLSGRIPSLKDSSGAIFIDRDPNLFSIILNYLRTRQIINLENSGLDVLKHEAEFYGITPLIKRLQICDDLLNKQTCGGDVLFQALLKTAINQPLKDQLRAKHENSELNCANPVIQIVAHHNAIAVAQPHNVTCYRLKDSLGWQCIFESAYVEAIISEIAFCYSCGVGPSMGAKLMIGLAHTKEQYICLWSVTFLTNNVGEGVSSVQEIGTFRLNNCQINSLFFIGSQLVALGYELGRVGVWHATSQHWLVQDLGQRRQAITAYDKAGCNFLLLGSRLGSIWLIDMQKFPLRMKDGDLLINELYEDPESEEITAISCYLTRTPKTNGNWIEIAYGTRGGIVRVLVQHPETVGHGPQLFQTFKVHLDGISKVMLSEKYLVSMCHKMHVRTWTLTRFRGRISTQPGSTPHASFRILKLDEEKICDKSEIDTQEEIISSSSEKSESDFDLPHDEVGPYGDQDDGDKQVFIEKLRSQSDHIQVIMASNGQRICKLSSVDGSFITTYCVHECEAVAMGNRSRRYILTGHNNGHVQIWDLTTAFELLSRNQSTHSHFENNPYYLLQELMN